MSVGQSIHCPRCGNECSAWDREMRPSGEHAEIIRRLRHIIEYESFSDETGTELVIPCEYLRSLLSDIERGALKGDK